jgi:2-amino-4-deoxychorismate synthase
MTSDALTSDGLAADALAAVLRPVPPPFALLHRPESGPSGRLEVLLGEVGQAATLGELPLPEAPGQEVLALLPFGQIRERGYAVRDDGAPILTLTATERDAVPVAEARTRLPDVPVALSGGRFDLSDDEYAALVRRVVRETIGNGEGANFVLKRSFVADIGGYEPRAALAFFRRLLEMETGAYWTFIVHTGERTFVGATPERHVTLAGGVATMNPISGTYRYPPAGPNLPDVLEFLSDQKESDELFMVLDEELKMVTRICSSGIQVVGPRFKEMARLAHTEYFIEGRTDRDVRDVLRETMFAPTVTGSPLENACRVIAQYEPTGRGYYSGVAALISRDGAGEQRLDSAILIRTAEISARGRLSIGVGATLVRHSDPASEVAETRAKAAGLLAALERPPAERLGDHPSVRSALARRNVHLSGFWLGPGRQGQGQQGPGRQSAAPFDRCRTLVVDAEDTFTAMLVKQLRSLGMQATLCRYDQVPGFEGHDLVVMGPGPGDPRDDSHPKIVAIRAHVRTLLEERRRFLAVCLSHQVLSLELGLGLHRRETPNQGVQREIDLFGTAERVGFYNTFAARSDSDLLTVPRVGRVEVCRDAAAGEVHALRGPHFSSVQFHAESVLTQQGPRILAGLAGRML